jgi:capsular polysaccharide biosynthesis protein
MTTGTNPNRLELAKTGDAGAARKSPQNIADELLRGVRGHWRLILLIAVIAALLGWIIAAVQPNRYRSASMAAVTPVLEAMPPGDRVRAITELDQRTIIATIAALAASPVVNDEVLAPAERAKGGYDIRAIALPNTNLLRVEVDGPSAERAAAIANRVPLALGKHTVAIFKYYGVTIVSPAAGGEHVFPRVGRTVAAGLIMGVILGIALAWALERFRRLPAASSS